MRLFISYARKDKARIHDLINILREGGYDPFFDQQLTGGRDWQVQLSDEIDACDVLIAVLTPHSIRSDWCRWELVRAIQLGKPIVPVMLKRVAVPRYLQRIMVIDLTNRADSGAIARLVHSIQHAEVVIPPRKAPDKLPTPKGSPGHAASSQTTQSIPLWLIGVAVVVVVWICVIALLASRPTNNEDPAVVAQVASATVIPTDMPPPTAIDTLAPVPSATPTDTPAPNNTATPMPTSTSEAEGYFQQGLDLYHQGDFAAAIDAYTRAIELDAAYASAYNNRGMAYRKMGEYEQAIADYTQAIQLDPDYVTAYPGQSLQTGASNCSRNVSSRAAR
jgi:hypothetical protein